MKYDNAHEAVIGFDHEIDTLFDEHSNEPVTNATMHEFAKLVHGTLLQLVREINK